jgi:glycosyltransferase involved in cell wall biosynthesis
MISMTLTMESPAIGPAKTPGNTQNFVSGLRGRDMLCFSHDWTGDPLSKNHLMRVLAKHNRILWVNSIGYRTPSLTSGRDISRIFKKLRAFATPVKEVEKNIFVLNPLAIPFYGPMGSAINRKLLQLQVRRQMKKLGFKNVINWVFNPAAGFIGGHLGEQTVVYYCVDEFTAFTGVASEKVADTERALLKRADLCICSADKLYEDKAPHNSRTYTVRHGVDFTHFRKAVDGDLEVSPDIANLPKPIIGFFGLIADWVDVDAMAQIAKHFSTGSLVVLGKVTTDVSALTALPNVHMLGRKPYSELPAYCKGFDVAINPFKLNRLTLNANPLKIREYLAAGLPVVSTDIPEVRILDMCLLGTSAQEYIARIEEALKDPGPSAARSDAIQHESWEARMDEVAKHVLAVEHEKSAKNR